MLRQPGRAAAEGERTATEEERRSEAVDWLVAMGFGRQRAALVAARSPLPSMEEMVEELMGSGARIESLELRHLGRERALPRLGARHLALVTRRVLL